MAVLSPIHFLDLVAMILYLGKEKVTLYLAKEVTTKLMVTGEMILLVVV